MTQVQTTETPEIETAGFPRQSVSINKSRVRWGEFLIKCWLALCAFVSIVTTAAIVILLLSETLNFFETVSPVEFFFGTTWTPMFEPSSYGVLPLVWGDRKSVV